MFKVCRCSVLRGDFIKDKCIFKYVQFLAVVQFKEVFNVTGFTVYIFAKFTTSQISIFIYFTLQNRPNLVTVQ